MASLIGLQERVAADDSTRESTVRPFLAKHCFECHGPKAAKKRLRLDLLPPEFSTKEQIARWQEVLEKVRDGEMPPEDKPRPPQEASKQVLDWVQGALLAADRAAQKKDGRVVLRRLNRIEYQNTLRDLLKIDVELKDLLPEDESADGFDNIAEALHISPGLMERYLQAAEAALDAAIVHEPKRPPLLQKRYNYKDAGIKNGNVVTRDDGVVFFFDVTGATVLKGFSVPSDGNYRVRISAQAFQSDKPMRMGVFGGNFVQRTGAKYLINHFDVAADKPTVAEFVQRMKTGEGLHIIPADLRRPPNSTDFAKYKGPGLLVQWVEVEGPLLDAWPPESHRRLFGNLPFAPVANASTAPKTKGGPKKKGAVVEKPPPAFAVTSATPIEDAERILRDFMPKAFRRPVTDDDVKPYLALVRGQLDQKADFEESVRVGLKATLCSPEFLFLKENSGRLNPHALACRLSYFLWSSMPDAELLALAKTDELAKPEVVRAQVERMLRDPKSANFTADFLGQWLDLRLIDFTTPDKVLYPDFDALLKVSMLKETELFFEEVLKNDLSLLSFVDSDFTFLNERLAVHYGVQGVIGQEFRKVKLPAGSVRGGVLTQASVLKVTANGTNSSPVIRGNWVLKNILGKPTPPPPPNVPAVEPDIRGTTTIRDQLAKHRQLASCAGCHNKIDPPGFALECFDPIGNLRDYYRIMGDNGKRVDLYVKGAHVRYKQGAPVDSSGAMPDGKRFKNIAEFKRVLLEDKDQIARCLTEKLITYSTGGRMRPADRQAVDEIVVAIHDKNYGLRSLIHEIAQRPIFLNK
jgi:mono/diheme cytochrome c family protein